MKKSGRVILLIFAGIIACSPHRIARAQTLSIAHPDDPAKKVEYFLEKPTGPGPWPAIILLHGHQDWPRAGGKDFVTWGVLDDFANRGYLAVSISQPGYGNSTGPADFCGPCDAACRCRRNRQASSRWVCEGKQDSDRGRQSRRDDRGIACVAGSFENRWHRHDLGCIRSHRLRA